jgi:translocation and assembly module TamB
VDGTWREENRAIEATAQADSLALAAMHFGNVDATVNGSGNAWNWSLATLARGQGQWAGGGRLVMDSASYSTTVDSLLLELGGVAWRAEPAGRVAFTSDSQVASDLVLRRSDGPGRVAVVGTLPTEAPAHMEVTVDSLPLRDVARFLGDTTSRVEGMINGRVVVDGPAAAPRYDLAAYLVNARLDTVELPSISVEARYADGEARGTATVTHEGRNLVSAEGVMPARVGFPPSIRADSAPITVSIDIDSIPGSLVDRLVPAVENVGGALTGDVNITGTLDNPDMRGTLVLNNASATLPALGTSWRNMRGTLRFAGDSVTVDRLRLNDASDGDFVANGTVRLDRLTDPLLNLEVQARDFTLIDTEQYGGVDGSGVVRLTGRPRSLALAGFIHIASAEIQVAEVASPDIVDLSDSLFRSFVDTTILQQLRPDDEFSASLFEGLRIDSLRVTVGNDVWVRSDEANIQLGGALLVRKIGERYPITGEITAVRGTYTMALGPGNDRNFTVTGGTIDFLRSDSLDADLDINARHTLRTVRGDQLTVFVHIGGTVSSPSITLRSDRTPALPQTEIISYLMFGAPTAQVFSGTGGRERRSFFEAGAEQFGALLAGRLEGTFSGAVDYFAISPGDPDGGYSEAEILVGKQVDLFGNPAFVTVSPRLCPGQPIAGLRRLGISIETWLTRKWMLDASLDPRRGCAEPNTATPNSMQLGIDLIWVRK